MIMKKCLFCILTLFVCLSCSDKNNMYSVYGTVSDYADGQPIETAKVTLERNHIPAESIVTGNDGSYQFQIANTNEDSAKITVIKDNYEPSSVEFVMPKRSESKADKHNFIIRRATIQFSGLVTDQSNTPIEGAKVYATIFISGNRTQVGAVMTDSNGAFLLPVPNQNQKNWTYYVTAAKDTYAAKTFNMGLTEKDNGKNFTINFALQKE